MSKAVDDTETPYSAISTTTALVDGRCAPSEYSAVLPEARDLFWNDDFFEEEEGIIAVFDFDYDQMILFQTQIKAAGQFLTVAFVALYMVFVLGDVVSPLLGPAIVVGVYLMTLAPCLLRFQVQWKVEANHLAITRDGIRFVQDKRKSCWGYSMCDKGKSSKTVPFDKITDCDIIEPAGNQYLFFPRILFVVNVDTASSGGEGHRHELQISGLKEPHRFKSLVWAMKRNPNIVSSVSVSAGAGYQAPDVAQLEMVGRQTRNDESAITTTASSSSSTSVTGLLKSIRDELRQNNELLRSMQNGPSASSSSGDGRDNSIV